MVGEPAPTAITVNRSDIILLKELQKAVNIAQSIAILFALFIHHAMLEVRRSEIVDFDLEIFDGDAPDSYCFVYSTRNCSGASLADCRF